MNYQRNVLGLLAGLAAIVCGENLDPSKDLDMMGNNTLFTRWRPTYHFISPAGWMNDPCGSMYDNNTKTYHLFYQFHPNHVNWGNISWGHATSKDLIYWTDVGGWQNDKAQALGTGPNGSYDHLGVFSGTAQPVGLTGKSDGNLTIFYTSVHELPTSWTLPYIPGTESQSLATSSDGGKTWQKYSDNPIIVDPPKDWNITGWRDPFFLPWPEVDRVLGQTEPHYYAIFGSGIKGVGPRLPFYSAPASNLTNWTYLGALFEPGLNESWGGNADITGSYGFNFEVAGVFSLVEDEKYGGDGETVHFFANFGTEGGSTTNHPNNHWALWAMGSISKRTNGSLEFTIEASGVGDWGNLYAVTSFWDSKNSRRVAWGWSEEDMNGYGIRAQGFQGSLGLPREWFVHVTHNVTAPSTGIPRNSQVWKQNGNTGLFTVTTLGAHPLPDVINGLRNGQGPLILPNVSVNGMPKVDNWGSDHFELSVSITNITAGAHSGVAVRVSPGFEEYTLITYDPSTSLVTVNRSHSSLITRFVNSSYSGHFAPYMLPDGPEALNMRVLVDGSLIEVFINDRFALTTRVYPSRDDAVGVAPASINGLASFYSMKLWNYKDVDVFPGRPANTSSMLVYDTPEETNNYVYWPGY